MENTNLSEEAIKLQELNSDIYNIEKHLESLSNEFTRLQVTLEKLKERKKSLLNYLNADNN